MINLPINTSEKFITMANLFKKILLVAAMASPLTTHAAETDRPISIGVNNWAENIAVANLWKQLLEEKGYKVKLQNADKALLYNGVAQERMDVTFEVWLPYTDKPAFDKVKDKVTLIGPWFAEANLGLAVPDYASIDSIEQLNSKKQEFSKTNAPTIFGIDSGSSLMALAEKARGQYQLDYKLLPSSESGMLMALERAEQRKESIVVTLWKPHYIWSKYKLRYLKDSKGVFGKSDGIYGIAAKSFKTNYPSVDHWLKQWKMDDNSLGALMSEINENGETNPTKGVSVWIGKNKALINQWLR